MKSTFRIRAQFTAFLLHEEWSFRVSCHALRPDKRSRNLHTVMNQVLHRFLDEFVVVHLDDIVIYSGTLAEHVEHLQLVLKRLREHELYAKVSKCSFLRDYQFLGAHCGERTYSDGPQESSGY
ncbi:UNVERIFIED_CONTAM: Retrovirus-related Pol polyprotein from transposon [Sesamum angustifolium]|uniref:Retrovirus-related Pol polyprotein from transposon n=1 Tax=Sesamum angustifolium TaxID=2727405 RepID=A0AAW2QSX0_9LAMI